MSLFSFSRFITSLNYLCETISITQWVVRFLWETRTVYPSRAPGFTSVYFMGSVLLIFLVFFIVWGFFLVWFGLFSLRSGLCAQYCLYLWTANSWLSLRFSRTLFYHTVVSGCVKLHVFTATFSILQLYIATTRLRSRENICQLLQTDRWNSVVMCRRLEL